MIRNLVCRYAEFLKIILWMYVCISAVLGLHCVEASSPGCGEQGCLSGYDAGFLTGGASRCSTDLGAGFSGSQPVAPGTTREALLM